MTTVYETQEQTGQKNANIHRVMAVLVLLVLAPTIAEVLLGDLLLNSNVVPQLVMDTLLYGSGAILIREVARRRHLGWLGIILLALAYGVIEEGLILSSLFNPHFLGLASMGSYGQIGGVSWFWASYVLGLHTVWSITIPILLTELLFPRLQHQPWLGRVGLGIDALVFVLASFVMFRFFQSFTHFSASPVYLLAAALTVVLLVSLALFGVPHLPLAADHDKSAPSPWLVGLLALLAGALFFGGFLFFPRVPSVPFLFPILLYVALYSALFMLIRRWSAQSQWSAPHRLALATGALLNTMIIGFRLVSKGSPNDLIVHGVLCVIFLLGLAGIAGKLRKSTMRANAAARDEKSRLHISAM